MVSNFSCSRFIIRWTRPKANILDHHQHPWIAKFPSKNDTIDKALWEYLTYKLAINAGIQMAECKIEKLSGLYHIFFYQTI